MFGKASCANSIQARPLNGSNHKNKLSTNTASTIDEITT
jgi:hypothetical protein